jgi:hypothetical protein
MVTVAATVVILGAVTVAAALGRNGGRPAAVARSPRPSRPVPTTNENSVCPTTITAGEVSYGTPTQEQRRAAARLISTTRAALRSYGDFSFAIKRGFRQLDQLHWFQPSWYADNRVLDPEHPEFLMYDDAHRLLGAMFIEHEKPGVQIGGSLTVWHTHCHMQMPCLLPGNILLSIQASQCKGHPQVHDWMLHVWLVPNRLGPFGQDMVAPSSNGP